MSVNQIIPNFRTYDFIIPPYSGAQKLYNGGWLFNYFFDFASSPPTNVSETNVKINTKWRSSEGNN
jgi:hypothetical protein